MEGFYKIKSMTQNKNVHKNSKRLTYISWCSVLLATLMLQGVILNTEHLVRMTRSSSRPIIQTDVNTSIQIEHVPVTFVPSWCTWELIKHSCLSLTTITAYLASRLITIEKNPGPFITDGTEVGFIVTADLLNSITERKVHTSKSLWYTIRMTDKLCSNVLGRCFTEIDFVSTFAGEAKEATNTRAGRDKDMKPQANEKKVFKQRVGPVVHAAVLGGPKREVEPTEVFSKIERDAKRVIDAFKDKTYPLARMIRNEYILNKKWAFALAHYALESNDNLLPDVKNFLKLIDAPEDIDYALKEDNNIRMAYRAIADGEPAELTPESIDTLLRNQGIFDLTRYGVEPNPGPHAFSIPVLSVIFRDDRNVCRAIRNKWTEHEGQKLTDRDIRHIQRIHDAVVRHKKCECEARKDGLIEHRLSMVHGSNTVTIVFKSEKPIQMENNAGVLCCTMFVKDLTVEGIEPNPGPIACTVSSHTEEASMKYNEAFETTLVDGETVYSPSFELMRGISSFPQIPWGDGFRTEHMAAAPICRTYELLEEQMVGVVAGANAAQARDVTINRCLYYPGTYTLNDNQRYELTKTTYGSAMAEAYDKREITSIVNNMRTVNSNVDMRSIVSFASMLYSSDTAISKRTSGEGLWFSYFMFESYLWTPPLVDLPYPHQIPSPNSVLEPLYTPPSQMAALDNTEFCFCTLEDFNNHWLNNLNVVPAEWKYLSQGGTVVIVVDDELRRNTGLLESWVMLHMGHNWYSEVQADDINLLNSPAGIPGNNKSVKIIGSHVCLQTPSRVLLVYVAPVDPLVDNISLFGVQVPYFINAGGFNAAAYQYDIICNAVNNGILQQTALTQVSRYLLDIYNDKEDIESAYSKMINAMHWYSPVDITEAIAAGDNDLSIIPTSTIVAPAINTLYPVYRAPGWLRNGAAVGARNEGAANRLYSTVVGTTGDLGPEPHAVYVQTNIRPVLRTNPIKQQMLLFTGRGSGLAGVEWGVHEVPAPNPNLPWLYTKNDFPKRSLFTVNRPNFYSEMLHKLKLAMITAREPVSGFNIGSFNYGWRNAVAADALATCFDYTCESVNVRCLSDFTRFRNTPTVWVGVGNQEQNYASLAMLRGSDACPSYAQIYSAIDKKTCKGYSWAPVHEDVLGPQPANTPLWVQWFPGNQNQRAAVPVRTSFMNNKLLGIITSEQADPCSKYNKLQWDNAPLAIGNFQAKVCKLDPLVFRDWCMLYFGNNVDNNTLVQQVVGDLRYITEGYFNAVNRLQFCVMPRYSNTWAIGGDGSYVRPNPDMVVIAVPSWDFLTAKDNNLFSTTYQAWTDWKQMRHSSFFFNTDPYVGAYSRLGNMISGIANGSSAQTRKALSFIKGSKAEMQKTDLLEDEKRTPLNEDSTQ